MHLAAHVSQEPKAPVSDKGLATQLMLWGCRWNTCSGFLHRAVVPTFEAAAFACLKAAASGMPMLRDTAGASPRATAAAAAVLKNALPVDGRSRCMLRGTAMLLAVCRRASCGGCSRMPA